MCECEAGCQLGWVPNRLAPEPPGQVGRASCGGQGGVPGGLGGSSLGGRGEWISFLYFWMIEYEEWWTPRKIGGDLVETFL